MRYGWLFFLLLLAQPTFALTCSESSYLQGLIQKQQYQQAIQVLDQCVCASGQERKVDIDLLNQLREILLTQIDVSEQQIYQNFQTLFQIQPLKNLEIQWSEDLEIDYPFVDLKLATEKYHFYYDTGRLQTQGRGIVLTDKAIIWKNMLGKAQRIDFSKIQQLELVHEYGLSLTAWQLRINQTDNIRLSQLPSDALADFLSAFYYFIQFHTEQDIKLDIPSDL
ncbi:hypothetical protein [Candidatus Albibeggiatoa sp. nov. NOAA]|uniref:hypothetical protein n=1 Tax=Candidatus Albibeggiatoa sp. nov. NOAA TaxID=3162724 RepID=UPI0032FE6BBF|nr:hypothetical protein [Thiotrichaceae bacterium]